SLVWLCFSCACHPPDLRSFPTRRSSDLLRAHEVRLLDGSPLTVPRLQLLGLLLGGNAKVDTLHYLLEEAFTGPDRAQLSDTFLADRKSTRLNSSHVSISYAVFCLKKKNA